MHRRRSLTTDRAGAVQLHALARGRVQCLGADLPIPDAVIQCLEMALAPGPGIDDGPVARSYVGRQGHMRPVGSAHLLVDGKIKSYPAVPVNQSAGDLIFLVVRAGRKNNPVNN